MYCKRWCESAHAAVLVWWWAMSMLLHLGLAQLHTLYVSLMCLSST